jgi:dTDP-4-amino-4,6-dideoxygalactose transaminase
MDFIDLKSQQLLIRDSLEKRIQAVLDHGRYIIGPEVIELESKLAEYTSRRFCVSCASGTDALLMALMAQGIGEGDIVFVPSFTFVATAEVVALLGAEPVFVDVSVNDFNIDIEDLEEALAWSKQALPQARARGIIAVDLFGQAADYQSLSRFAEDNSLFLIQDAAQSFGAEFQGKKTCGQGIISCTSFFPAKPLGCYGDGGAIFCDDEELLNVLHSIRVHGQGVDKYQNVRIGLTGRMDTIQAAILLEKLSIFDNELSQRNAVASRYNELLSEYCKVPIINEGNFSAWAQYTVLVDDRESLVAALKEEGIPTAVYYPIPLHQQVAYSSYQGSQRSLANCESLSNKVLSLPMHPYLDEQSQEKIAKVFEKQKGKQ